MAGSAGGAFNGLYQGSSGSAAASAALKPLLPNISVYQQGPSTAPALAPQVTTPAAPSSGGGGVVSTFEHFLGGLGSETGHIAAGAASWLGRNVVDAGKGVYNLGPSIGHGIVDRLQLDTLQQQTQQQSNKLTSLHDSFKAGHITAKQYLLGLKELGQTNNDLANQAGGMINKVAFDQNTSTKALITTASTLITLGWGINPTSILMKDGSISLADTGVKTAGDWLAGAVAKPILTPAIDLINRAAFNPEVFKAMDAASKIAIQRSTAEVVASAGEMTASQMAHATAANLALKYPINFSVISPQANQIYNELSQHKYGDAVSTLGLNAVFLLSGGPIGAALKWGGEALKSTKALTFGESSFWDELSKFYGDRSPDGFALAISNAAAKLAPAERKVFLNNLSAVEQTNLGAVGGNEIKAGAIAAAARVATGMKGQYSTDLSSITHEQAIQDMVNFAKNQRLADAEGKRLGLGTLTVGRFDGRDKAGIANVLGNAPTDGRAQAWEDWKAANPNSAGANNAGLDRQIQQIIGSTTDSEELKAAITNIKSLKPVKGFSDEIMKSMAKDGYVPIQPSRVEAPFKEGIGDLKTGVTVRGQTPEFFMKTVQPLPVVSTFGSLLTHLGLSPEASTQRTYQMFTEHVGRNLSSTKAAISIDKALADKQALSESAAAEKAAAKATKAAVSTTGYTKDELAIMEKQGITPELLAKGHVTGETPVQSEIKALTKPVATTTKEQQSASDLMLKRLSDYAHSLRVPVTDMRMLTNKHIQEALKVGYSDAREVQNAITKAYIDIPMSIRGLGDKAVDWSYGLPVSSAVQRRYLRIQGALRFSFNPFFQYLRVIPKTEILSTAEGGGAIRSIFQGRTGEISKIRQLLKDGDFLEKQSGSWHQGNVISGDAVDFAGFSGNNLAKKLLPMQERSIAGIIDSQAQRMNMSAEDYLKQYPHQAADTIQAIAEYSKKSNFINSPLARTLNVAIFPFRFDTKVATILTKSLGRQPLLTQVAVINGMMKAHTWLNSPEGNAWYAQNKEAISVFKYITPLASLSDAFQSLLPGHDHSLGNFGELGGLPFGWIPQLTDAEGLTQFNQTGTDAKTGAAIPHYIPATTKGQAAIAIQDLLSTLFSYPGTQLGLPSKTAPLRKIGLGLVQGKQATDLQLSTPSLSPADQQYQKNVGGSSNQPAPPNYESNSSGTQQVTPTSTHATITPKAKNGGVKKLKKGDFIPPPAPGQSALGVL